MPISLAKGQKINLTKDNPGLKKILVGLGWDTNRYDGGHDFDLDVSVFMTGANGKCSGEKDFIFYNHKEHASGAVIHMGDNRTGDGNGDDEPGKGRSFQGTCRDRKNRFYRNDRSGGYPRPEFRHGIQCLLPYRQRG